MRQFEQMRATWDADALELTTDFVDAGDRVAVRFVWHGLGQGPEANVEITYLGTVRKRRIINVEYLWDHAEALEALGLRE